MLEYLRKPMRLAGLCIIITLLGTISLTSGAQFFESLPVQACANIIHEARVNDVLLTLNGSRAIFRVPHYKGGDIDLDSKLYFQWTDIQEYGRTTERCAPGVNDLIFATTLNSCRCTVTNIDKVVNGVSIAGVDMVIDQCPAPQSNVVGKASFIHTNVTITEVHNNTMPGSTADSFTYTTPAGEWKFSIAVSGWTWNTSSAVASYPENTYVAAGLQMGFESPRNMSVSMDLTEIDYSVHTTFGTTDLVLKIDLGLLLDDQASIPDFFNAFPPLNFPEGSSFLGIDMPLTFCQPTPSFYINLTKWNNMYSDPSLQVIFGAFGPDDTSSNAQKNTKKVVAIAASVVVVVVVLTLASVVVGVLLYRHYHNPMAALQKNARLEAREGAHAEESNPVQAHNPNWAPASKPSLQ